MSPRPPQVSRLAALFLATLAILVGTSTAVRAQVPVLYYDFENNTTRTVFENAVEAQMNAGSGAITRAGGAVAVGGVGGAGTFNGGAATGQAGTSASWSAATTDPGAAATDYYQFTVSSTGLAGLSVTFDDQASNAGPA